MPTVLRQDGYQFKIYLRDNPPAHVHVKRAGNEATVHLHPPEVITNWGFSDIEINEILGIMYMRGGSLIPGQWDKYHLNR